MTSLTITTLLVGFVFCVTGTLVKLFTPAKINWFYGYRTHSSMQNEDTWIAANIYAAGVTIFSGVILIGIALISLLIPDIGKIGIAIGLGFFVTSVILIFVLTESHLKIKFDKEGKQK